MNKEVNMTNMLGNARKRKGAAKLLIVVIVILAVLVISGIGKYNSLVALNEGVDEKWAQVENVLKRRADLIPNLVETVRGYASHEEEVFTKVTEARTRVNEASTPEAAAEANAELDRALVSLNAVAEAYPELKANQNFLNLQDELSGTENRIATERMRYNEVVADFNKTVKRFPTNLYAKVLGFEAREYFEISEADREVPKVEF